MPVRQKRHNAVLGTFALAFLLSTACARPSERDSGTLPLSGAFSGQSGAQVVEGQWWKALGDPVLDAYIQEALTKNFSLEATRARLAQARADASALNGGTLPSVNTEVDIGNRTSLGNVPGFNVTGTTWSAGLAASYELDVWGGIRSAKQGARASVYAAQFDVEAAAITLSAEVAIAWYRWVEASEQHSLRLEQSETSKQILALVEARYSRGLVSAQEVFRQRQVVDATIQSELASFSEGSRWQNRLATLLAKPSEQLKLPKGTTIRETAELPAVGTPIEIIQQRPDLRALYQRLASADAAAATAVTQRYPRLSLRAAVTTSSKSVSSLFQNWLLTLGGNLLTPLFDGGRLKAQAASAKSAAEVAWFNYAQASLNAVAEVENALTSDFELSSQVASLTRQVELAEHGLAVARAGYTAGQTPYLQALDAVLTLQGLERALLEARRNAIVARINLHRAVAGPINKDGIKDDNE